MPRLTVIPSGSKISLIAVITATLAATIISTTLLGLGLYSYGYLIEGPRFHVRHIGEGIGLIILGLIFAGFPASIISAVSAKLMQLFYLRHRPATIGTVLIVAMPLSAFFGHAFDDGNFGPFWAAGLTGGAMASFIFYRLQTGKWI